MVSTEETAKANPQLTDDRLSFIITDLQQHPFSLEISADRYISRSRDYVRADRYEPLGYEDSGAIVIKLSALTSDEPTTRPGATRAARLQLRDDHLWLGPNDGVTVVFTRRQTVP